MERKGQKIENLGKTKKLQKMIGQALHISKSALYMPLSYFSPRIMQRSQVPKVFFGTGNFLLGAPLPEGAPNCYERILLVCDAPPPSYTIPAKYVGNDWTSDFPSCFSMIPRTSTNGPL